jgi:hypothetical protein
MSNHTTVCANVLCANSGKMNNLKLESSSDGGTNAITGTPLLTLTNTHADGNGPILKLKNDPTATGTSDNDIVAQIVFEGDDDAEAVETYGKIVCTQTDNAAAGPDAKMELSVDAAGTTSIGLSLTSSGSAGVVNATVGLGAASTVSVPGALSVTGTLTTKPGNTFYGPFNLLTYMQRGDTVVAAGGIGAQMNHVLTPIKCLYEVSNYLAGTNAGDFTAAETNRLLGIANGVAEASVALEDAGTGTLVGQRVTRLTGPLAAAQAFGDCANSFTTNGTFLLIFDGNLCTDGGAITISLDNTDGFDASGAQVHSTADEANGVGVYIDLVAPTDADNDLIITVTAATTIVKGSFLYFAATGANLMAIHGIIRTTGGTAPITWTA